MYVAITDSLVYDIRNQIGSMQRAELLALPSSAAAVEKALLTNTTWELIDSGLRVKYNISEEAHRAVSQWPIKGTTRLTYYINRADVEAHGVTPSWQGERKEFTLDTQAYKVPCYAHADVSGYGAMLRVGVGDLAAITPDGPEAVRQYALTHECEQRWGKVQDDITSFVRSAKSLNEAVKLLPALRNYVPQKYLDRVDEKSGKRESTSAAAEKLKVINMDNINMSSVLAKMAETGDDAGAF